MTHDDYDIDFDTPCPACGHHTTHFRHCAECDSGFIDEHDDDPINFAPGEEFTVCQECCGHGIERWCPKCGADYWRASIAAKAAVITPKETP